VYGTPHEVWGEAVTAAVVLRPGAHASAEQLVAHCRAHIAAYKCPKSVRFLDALPRTGTGKIQKRALREPRAPRS
jgi:long-chain acyl-CoA synthetase